MGYNRRMVIVYSAVWCGFCHAAKQYFDKIGVKYEDRDVEENPTYAKEAIEKSGQMGIPVIEIDGSVVVGFDKPKIDQLLKDKQLLK